MAVVYSFRWLRSIVTMIFTVKYENVKYRNSPYYKAAKLWDTLPNDIKDIGTILELKRLLKIYFSPFDEYYFEI